MPLLIFGTPEAQDTIASAQNSRTTTDYKTISTAHLAGKKLKTVWGIHLSEYLSNIVTYMSCCQVDMPAI